MTDAALSSMNVSPREWKLPYRGKVAVMMIIVTGDCVVFDFCCRLSLLHRKKLERSLSQGCFGIAGLGNHLPPLQQHHCCHRRTGIGKRLAWKIQALLADYNRSRNIFSRIHRSGMEKPDLSRSFDHQHEFIWKHLLSVSWIARKSRDCGIGLTRNCVDPQFIRIRK